MVEMFIHTREYIDVILGKECNNFLSPTHYLCPIRGCLKNATGWIQQDHYHYKGNKKACHVNYIIFWFLLHDISSIVLHFFSYHFCSFLTGPLLVFFYYEPLEGLRQR